MPGTGKTALLMEAIDSLQGEKAVPAFTTVHVNAMRLGAPGAVFGCILSQLPGVEVPTARTAYPQPAVARGELERFFAERRETDPVIFVLVDEIDHLVTMNQAVLYRLFDWLAQPRARLVIAAISNTMDLPERLMPRVASRFDIVRVDFEPYNRFQLHQILCERLRGYDAERAFDSLSLEFCAARVASGSGDIRKALQLCRRSGDFCPILMRNSC
jgi:Cdc6-like AAA superfamily ATPase